MLSSAVTDLSTKSESSSGNGVITTEPIVMKICAFAVVILTVRKLTLGRIFFEALFSSFKTRRLRRTKEV